MAKQITQRERKLRAEAKRRLQAEGIIPPDKPRLNRKKFAKEVLTEFEEVLTPFDADLYLRRAIYSMVRKDSREVTPEQVGILKLLKLAVETKKFEERQRAEGKTQYKFEEFFEEVYRPIVNL